MALYLGSEKICPTFIDAVEVNTGGISMAEGTATVDDYGYVELPQLNFVPRTIVLYKYETFDAGDILEDYDTYLGAICTYVYVDNYGWISMILTGASGQFAVSGATADNYERGETVEDLGDGYYGLYTARYYPLEDEPLDDNSSPYYDVVGTVLHFRAYA